MRNSLPKFQQEQYAFTAHVRDPESNPAPAGIEDRRMEIYRGLLYRNVQKFVANAFPVLRKLYRDDDWHLMVRDFFIHHHSSSPYFRDISREFLNYLDSEHEQRECDPPFLLELAHYEWLEIYFTFLDVDPEKLRANRSGNLLNEIPVLSPLAEMYSYRYPVHRIGPEFQPSEAEPRAIFIAIYRDLNDKVGFIEMNPITARLMELLKTNQSKSGRELLLQISDEIPDVNQQAILQGGTQILAQLFQKDILLGTKL